MAFKMKGHTLPGINQKGNKGMKDGRANSSPFQQEERRKNTSIEGDVMTNTDTGDTYNLTTGETTKNRKLYQPKKPKRTMTKKMKKKSPLPQTVVGGSTKSDMAKDIKNQQAKHDSTKFVTKTGINKGKVPSVKSMSDASKHLSNERFDAMMKEIRKNQKSK